MLCEEKVPLTEKKKKKAVVLIVNNVLFVFFKGF